MTARLANIGYSSSPTCVLPPSYTSEGSRSALFTCVQHMCITTLVSNLRDPKDLSIKAKDENMLQPQRHVIPDVSICAKWVMKDSPIELASQS